MVKRLPRQSVVVLLLLSFVVACSPNASGGSAAPASPPGASPEAVIDPAIPRGCFGLAEPDCMQALAAAALQLDPAGAAPTYVQVGPFSCRAGEGCEPSLAARPAGSVLFEFESAAPVQVAVELQADGTFAAERLEAFTVEVGPSSPSGTFSGPMPFSLGHCGLGSGIDVDGSWWDPVGLVNSDHGDAINGADGTIAPTGPDQATFTSTRGLVVSLVRHRGVKHLPLCQ